MFLQPGTVEEYPTKAKTETSCSCKMAIFILIGAVIVIGTVIPVILQCKNMFVWDSDSSDTAV